MNCHANDLIELRTRERKVRNGSQSFYISFFKKHQKNSCKNMTYNILDFTQLLILTKQTIIIVIKIEEHTHITYHILINDRSQCQTYNLFS